MRSLPFIAAALLFSAAPARAINWFALDSLSAASGLGIEVDTDSLKQIGTKREIAVRVSYPEPRLHRGGAWFRSVVATVEFECEGRVGGYRDAVFFSDPKGQGTITVREEGPSGTVPARIMDLLPAKSLEVMARAACARPTPAAR
jgi:hypothetical protein